MHRHEPTTTSVSFQGPFLLLVAGSALGMILVPSPLPHSLAYASYAAAFMLSMLACALAQRNRPALVTMLYVMLTFIGWVFAFTPRSVDNRKVTDFNSWAHETGRPLPQVDPGMPPNYLAGMLAVALALAWSQSGRARGLAWAGGPLLAVMLVLTASRAGWLAGSTIALLTAAHHRIETLLRLFIAIVTTLLVLVLLAGTPPPGKPALLPTQSLAMRWRQWKLSPGLLTKDPLSGLGPVRFPYKYANAAATAGQKNHKTLNNGVLQAWIDAGILGIIALDWIGWRAWQIRHRLVHKRQHSRGWLRCGAWNAGSGLAVHGIFEANWVAVVTSGRDYIHLASPAPYRALAILSGPADLGEQARLRPARIPMNAAAAASGRFAQRWREER